MNLFRGTHVLPGSTEDFDEICKKIGISFTGAMRFLGSTDGGFYLADLLVRNGNIIGASFEDLKKRTVTFKEDAIGEIKKRFIGSVGTLDVYAFSEDDMKIVMMNNNEAIFDLYSQPIPLSAIGVKIKQMNMEVLEPTSKGTKNLGIKPKEKFNFGGIFGVFKGRKKQDRVLGGEIEKPDTDKHIDKIQVAGTGSGDDKAVMGGGIDTGDITGILKKVDGNQSSIKEERLSELRRKRQMTDMALIKKISKIGKDEVPVKSDIHEYEKIETSIDKLYELVQKHKRVRISDELAHKLGITRTQIESWAVILEEHNLVELHYSTMGEPEIREKGFIEKKA